MFDIFSKKRQEKALRDEDDREHFILRYKAFREILKNNNEVLITIADMQEKTSGIMSSRDPRSPQGDAVPISALLGLGAYVVGGVVSTHDYRVSGERGKKRASRRFFCSDLYACFLPLCGFQNKWHLNYMRQPSLEFYLRVQVSKRIIQTV